MDAEGEFHIELRQQADYRFEVHFDKPGIPVLITDEGAPVGAGAGPSPSQLMGTAVANCLAASLLFAMRKYKNEPGPLRVVATVRMVRNENRRLRIGGIDVELQLGIPAAEVQMLDRVLAQFEDFCVVTQSVRAAIPVTVRVMDNAQTALGTSAIVSGGPAQAV
jgi:organic hydroperoxide reductase OsmC/OhrA